MKHTLLALCLIYETSFSQNVTQLSSGRSVLSDGFVENKGQVMDQNYKTNTSVLFIYSKGYFNLQLKKDGFSYELFQPEQNQAVLATAGALAIDEEEFFSLKDIPGELRSHRIDIKFLNSDPHVEVIPENWTGVPLNYYTANTGGGGIIGVQSYYQVIYKNVYPGIDLKFSAPQEPYQSLKYEWIVKPGADPSAIRLQYQGIDGLVLINDGSINVPTSTGIINEGKIYASVLEDCLEVNAEYRVRNNVLSYQGLRKNDQTIIIDPNITWFSYYGGNYDEDLFEGEMAVDAKGNPILVGNTPSTQYIASTGAFQTQYSGMVDAFIAKFKSNGKLSWATYYGSTNRDGGHAITSDQLNNIFMAGNTFSANGIATAGSHQPVFGGLMDAFIAKFNSNGIREWATYFGGSGYGDQINGVDCDGFGNLYFAGYTASFNQIATSGVYQETLNGSDYYTGDAMLGEFTSSGKLIWCSYFSGPGQDRAHKIVLGKNADLYIAGTCESTSGFATADVHQVSYGGGPQDAFIAKWDTNGNFFWCSYYGGEDEEHERGLASDGYGNAYLSGWTNSETGISTTGAFQENWYPAYNLDSIGIADCYLAKFNPDGSLEWATYYGGEGVDRARAIAIDKDANHLYLAGQTISEVNVANQGLFQADIGLNSMDGFLTKFTTDGSRVWSYYVGGPGEQIVFDADIDNKNFLYLYLVTDHAFFTSSGVYQSASNGGDEVLLIKLNPSDSCYDSYEPNNSISSPKDITISSDTAFYGYHGGITTVNDTDWFRIKTLHTNLKIELVDLPADYDLYLYKYSGQLIFSSANPGVTEEVIIYNDAPKGRYYIQVVPGDIFVEPNDCYRMIPVSNDSPWSLKTADGNAILNSPGLQVYPYPNPFGDLLNLKIISNKSEALHATIHNLVQEKVWSSEFMIKEGTQSVTADLEQAASGIYLLYLQTESKTFMIKLVKK